MVYTSVPWFWYRSRRYVYTNTLSNTFVQQQTAERGRFDACVTFFFPPSPHRLPLTPRPYTRREKSRASFTAYLLLLFFFVIFIFFSAVSSTYAHITLMYTQYIQDTRYVSSSSIYWYCANWRISTSAYMYMSINLFRNVYPLCRGWVRQYTRAAVMVSVRARVYISKYYIYVYNILLDGISGIAGTSRRHLNV